MMVFASLILFTALSKLFSASPVGVALVASGSMEPTIHVLDLAVYVGGKPSVGDVVVWCNSPSLCVVHRLAEATDKYLVTKGDANPAEDPPVPWDSYRGKVVFVISRLLWIPIFAIASAVIIAHGWRTLDTFSLALLLFLLFNGLIFEWVFLNAGYVALTPPSQPTLYLSRAYLNYSTCLITVSYVGDMDVLEASVSLEGVRYANHRLNYTVSSKEVVVYPPLELLTEAHESGDPIDLKVRANLTRYGVLTGLYRLRVYAVKPLITIEGNYVVVENKACFSAGINITFIYANKAGEPWKTEVMYVTVGGHGREALEVPNATYVYLEVRYRAGGREWTERLRIR